MQETPVWFLGWEDPLEKGKVTHSSILAWRIPWIIQSLEFSRPEYWSGSPFPSPGDLPTPGIEPRSPSLQADSLLAEPHGKPKNTGVGSLPLLQWIFLTQELNQGVLHCRQILYQWNYQGSPYMRVEGENQCAMKNVFIYFWTSFQNVAFPCAECLS